jgi:hypothetical protein
MRARSRRQPNPINRIYESNGPDVKIRGTAQHVAEKYMQLGRDALSSGDEIRAESYFQHAEHYYRIIAAAQEQIQQRRQQQQEQREQRMRGNGRSRPQPLVAPEASTAAPEALSGRPGEDTQALPAAASGNGDIGALTPAADAEAPAPDGNGRDPGDTIVETAADEQNGRAADVEVVDLTPSAPAADGEGNGADRRDEPEAVAESAWGDALPGFLMQPVLPADDAGEMGSAAETAADGDAAEKETPEKTEEASASDTAAEAAEAAGEGAEASGEAESKPKRTRRTRTTRRTRRTTRKTAGSTDAPAASSGDGAAAGEG